MTYFFHICICFALVILQTTIMPYFSFLDKFYDLLSPFVVYLSLFRSTRESLPVILLFGFIMDNLSGGPFGLYLTTYLWLFIGVRWVVTYVDIRNSILFPFVVAAGVLIQNLMFIGAIMVLRPGSWFSSLAVKTISTQVFWAIFTGPIFLMLFSYLHKKFFRRMNEMFSKKASSV